VLAGKDAERVKKIETPRSEAGIPAFFFASGLLKQAVWSAWHAYCDAQPKAFVVRSFQRYIVHR
jgi:hypothetical protein